MDFTSTAEHAAQIRANLHEIAHSKRPNAERLSVACAQIVEYLRHVIQAEEVADSFEQITKDTMPKSRGRKSASTTSRNARQAGKRGKAAIAIEQTEAPVVGNPVSKEFHIRRFASGSCQIEEIDAPVEFQSVDEAIQALYKGCGHCLARLSEGEPTSAD